MPNNISIMEALRRVSKTAQEYTLKNTPHVISERVVVTVPAASISAKKTEIDNITNDGVPVQIPVGDTVTFDSTKSYYIKYNNVQYSALYDGHAVGIAGDGHYCGFMSQGGTTTLMIVALDTTNITDMQLIEKDIKKLDNMYMPNDLNVNNSITVGARRGEIGLFSSSFGNACVASGVYSFAEGGGTTASGDVSHAEGRDTTASGNYSHAEGGDTTASGNYSHAEGDTTTASGNYSHAEGDTTTASGDKSHAEGYNTTASGNLSHAEGYTTTASGLYSHVEGYNTTASSNYQHVQGKFNIDDAEGKYAHIVGNGAKDETTNWEEVRSNAHTLDWEGNAWYAGDVQANNLPYVVSENVVLTIPAATITEKKTEIDNATQENFVEINVNGTVTYDPTKSYYMKYNNKEYSLAYNRGMFTVMTDDCFCGLRLGDKGVDSVLMIATLDTTNITDIQIIEKDIKKLDNKFLESDLKINNSITVGDRRGEIGLFSSSCGINCEASGDSSHAEGAYTTASGEGSHAEGNGSKALDLFSHAEGNSTTASGNSSHAEGESSKASGDCSHAEGFYTTASGESSHAEGGNTTALGFASHAEGNSTTASGDKSHAEGNNTTASGDCSHAEGNNTTASHRCAHAEGYETTASGDYSHAEGYSTTASGHYSHTEGDDTTASGFASHAEGAGNIASGDYSHAEGSGTTASGINSHAEGNYTKASSRDQHVQGKFNIEDTEHKYAHIVGNGDSGNKSNAHTLDWEGNAWYAGKLSQEGTPTEDKDLVTKKYVDEHSADVADGFVMNDQVSGYKYLIQMKGGVLNSALLPSSISVDASSLEGVTFMEGDAIDVETLTFMANYPDGSSSQIIENEGNIIYSLKQPCVCTGTATTFSDHDLLFDVDKSFTLLIDFTGDSNNISGNGVKPFCGLAVIDPDKGPWYGLEIKSTGSYLVYYGAHIFMKDASGNTIPYNSTLRQIYVFTKEKGSKTIKYYNLLEDKINTIDNPDLVYGVPHPMSFGDGGWKGTINNCVIYNKSFSEIEMKSIALGITTNSRMTCGTENLSYTPSELTTDVTQISFVYTIAGLKLTYDMPITVTAFDPAVKLQDFEYTANADGTYTLTGWKGTYNGVASTELIIPNNKKIIL